VSVWVNDNVWYIYSNSSSKIHVCQVTIQCYRYCSRIVPESQVEFIQLKIANFPAPKIQGNFRAQARYVVSRQSSNTKMKKFMICIYLQEPFTFLLFGYTLDIICSLWIVLFYTEYFLNFNNLSCKIIWLLIVSATQIIKMQVCSVKRSCTRE
jgi:hypothetical protein